MSHARYRILIVDDNPAIHEDVRKVLGHGRVSACDLAKSHADLFAEYKADLVQSRLDIESAMQGRQGVEMVRCARESHQPYALAFVDARMPPGWDGIETIAKLWERDPDVQIVLCTAYSDYSWQDIRAHLRHPERLIVLKKPFDGIEVLQLVDSLTEKWRLLRHERGQFQQLQQQLKERKRDLLVAEGSDAQLAPIAPPKIVPPQSRRTAGQQNERRALLQRELPAAVGRDQLTLHYHPLVEIATRRLVSLEALLRWTHPELGPVSPGEFIPIAEESGLILDLGEFALRSACGQLRRWEREGVPIVPVAVNVSGVQLERLPLRDLVRLVLKESGVAPHSLILELTESALVRAPRSHARALQQLRDDGVSIEIDDFGTGYSSLSYLKHLPVDAIKIDRSFIHQLPGSSTDEAIVCAILAMAHKLGLRAVAEGVETAGQLEALGRYGCQLAQGFFFCRPLDTAECRELLLDLSRRTSFTDTVRLRKLAGDSAAFTLDPPTQAADLLGNA